ncbi:MULTISPECIES: hypothetical protein [Pseudoalteromonas]|uniref:hypothetical protein n=1 Tax=Pseudoalteromonas TaxID=53246 RepID=UPI00035ED3A5|nr:MULTISPECIES: hypothetical protein [Pseudoalteromonas]MDP4486765.1 hypothetical protein [Pseudoalteromonas piscicida]
MNKFFDNFYNFGGFGPAIEAIQPTDDVNTTPEKHNFSVDKPPPTTLNYISACGLRSRCDVGRRFLDSLNSVVSKE